MTLTDFKTFQKDRLQMEDLIALSAFGRAYEAEFKAQQVDVPEFVKEQNAVLGREIQAKVGDSKAARIKQIQTKLHSLKTQTELRAELEKELASLAPPVPA